MTPFRFAAVLIASLAALVTSTGNLAAATQVWFVLERPFPSVYQGAVFSTELKVSNTNGIIGAIDVVVRYNPSVLRLVEFVPTVSSSGFDSDCFAQAAGVSGETRLVCFQTSDDTPPGNPRALGTIRWEVVGATGASAKVSIEPRTVSDTQLNSVEVMSFGQELTVLPKPSADPDPESAVLANTVQPVYWYYIRANGDWYIIGATAISNPSVLKLDSVDANVEGGIRWKPINNYPSSAGFAAAQTSFSSVTVSRDGRTVQFGAATSSVTDPDVTALANSTHYVSWFYTAIGDMSKWYIVEAGSQADPAVVFLKAVDPREQGGIRWKPISNYPAFAGFPTASINYQTISISADGKTIVFGAMK